MRLYTLLTHSVLLPTLVLAHADGFGGPKIFGRNAIADLRKRNVFTGPLAAPLVKREPSPELGRRAEVNTNVAGQCGAGFTPSSCAPGYCCSPAGYCGIGPDYCNGPDCQLDYGPGCDANKTPPGTNTSSIPRPALGSVLYGGAGIYQCTEPGTIAITYDDGPYIYTSYILDLLKSYSSKATFFITANNNGKGEIDDPNTAYPAMIRRMRTEGHQIASHTWTHQDLSKITPTQRKAQMIKAEMALRNILGFIPTYMRPPYSSCDFDSGCAADMKTLGYHITYFDVDTNDYNLAKPELIQGAKDNFVRGIKGNAATDDHLVIAHDIHQQTAYNLTQFMLGQLLAQGYKAVTVGQCLGDPQANWYRTASGAGSVSTATSSSASPSSTGSKPISRDATCGPATGFTCQGSSFGNCCSSHSYCGSTSDYCGTGCQSGYGTCNGAAVPALGSSSTASIPASSASSASSAASARPTGTTPVTKDATCGPANGFTCQGSQWGNCCSVNGYCGSTSAYCGTGCQSGYGTCTSTSSASANAVSSPTPSAASASKPVTTDATCGPAKGFTCQGSQWGNCCSVNGYCGSTSAYCGTGCQPGYGTCTSSSGGSSARVELSTSTISSTTTQTVTALTGRSTTLVISMDGSCGEGVTCAGSSFGKCCSPYGYCGETIDYCGTGCQMVYGTCNA